MDIVNYFPLWIFIIFMVATPGPANMLLLTAGSQHGFIRVIPFLCGLVTGKLLLNLSIASGLATVLTEYPFAARVLALVSAGYMIFLAVQGWNRNNSASSGKQVFGFFSGLIVHPLNPKAWVMATLAFSRFAVDYDTVFEKYFLVAFSFVGIQIVFHSLWCLCGAMLQKSMAQSIVFHRLLIVVTVLVILWALLL